MVHRVSSKARRVQAIGVVTEIFGDLVRTDVGGAKFVARLYDAEILGREEHRLSEAERARRAVSISLSRHLGPCLLEQAARLAHERVGVKSFERGFGTVGGRVETVLEHERRCSRGCADGVVVSELGDRQQSRPVVLIRVNEAPKVTLERLISSFGLPVGFWVVRRGHFDVRA